MQQQQPQPPQQFNQLDDDEPKNSDESINATEDSTSKNNDDDASHIESNTPNDSDMDDNSAAETEDISEKVEETTSVEQRLRKISEEIEKFSGHNSGDKNSDVSQSFLSLSDLIQNNRKLNQMDRKINPIDRKIIPQIDSDYSKSMHVQGETIVSGAGGDDLRKIKDLRHTNRALY